MMVAGKVIVDKREGSVALLILNNPERRNPIDPEMIGQLVQALEEMERDDGVKVIVLTGQGDHFSSGGDLKLAGSEEWSIEGCRGRENSRHNAKPVRAIWQMEKPVIAMVKGYAIGGGMSLALACDIIFAADDAKFASNFLRIGLIPEMGALCFLPIAVGLNRAKELWFSAKQIDVHEAYRLGIVNQVFPKEKLEEETLSFAKEIAEMPTVAVRITKRILNATFLNMLDNILENEAQAIPFCGLTKEVKENIAAFREKRGSHFFKKK